MQTRLFYFPFQTQTKTCNQQAAVTPYRQMYGTNMASSKDAKRPEETKLKDVEVKENANPNKNCENETEHEDRPLQIDTTNENKVENCETPEKTEQVNRKKKSMDSSTDSSTTPTKKVRSKPKPQIIENMKQYVDSNTIEKLTTTTLLHWLRERNLHCSTRDKKAELIQKVKKHFADSKSCVLLE